MKDPFPNYLDEVKKRLRHHARENIVAICDDFCLNYFQNFLDKEEYDSIRFISENEIGSLSLQKDDVLWVTYQHHSNGNKIYHTLEEFKKRGHVVSLVCPSRRLNFSSPGWGGIGVTYDGMFRLASLYLPAAGQGVYAEFGVFDGKTFSLAYHALKDVCSHFYAFDSFSGIIGTKDEEKKSFSNGLYYCNRKTFESHMALIGSKAEEYSIIEGPFQDTLQQEPSQHGLTDKVIMAHIDADIYEAAKLALDYLAPILAQNALILFDDYDVFGADCTKGERRAVQEWLKENPSFSLEPYRNYGTFCRSFIFHR